MANLFADTLLTKKTLPKPSAQRMEWVDYARGLAIILVVYRHTMVGLKRAAIDVPAFLYNIQEFLVNVRMPVFFVLSGIFLWRSLKKKPPNTLIKNKAFTLLYPYLLWTIIFITIQIFLSDYTNSKRSLADYSYIVLQPRELDHMWYLLALFNTSFVLILCFRFLLDKPFLHLAIGVFLHCMHYWLRDYSLFSDLCYYYIFLALGVSISKFAMEYDKKPIAMTWKLFFLTLPVFIAGQVFWLKNINENYEPVKNSYLPLFLIIILIACLAFYCICKILYS